MKTVRGPTMQQSGYHHANVLADQIRSELQNHLSNRDSEVLAMLQIISDSSSTPTEPEVSSPSIESMNIATSNTTQLQMLQLLREI